MWGFLSSQPFFSAWRQVKRRRDSGITCVGGIARQTLSQLLRFIRPLSPLCHHWHLLSRPLHLSPGQPNCATSQGQETHRPCHWPLTNPSAAHHLAVALQLCHFPLGASQLGLLQTAREGPYYIYIYNRYQVCTQSHMVVHSYYYIYICHIYIQYYTVDSK